MANKKTRCGGEWTDARYFGFIRSALRRASLRWKPIRDAKESARRPYVGPVKRRKWEYKCCECERWFFNEEVQVDHVAPCGPLNSFDDLPRFVERLFCEEENLCVRCQGCHAAKRRAE